MNDAKRTDSGFVRKVGAGGASREQWAHFAALLAEAERYGREIAEAEGDGSMAVAADSIGLIGTVARKAAG